MAYASLVSLARTIDLILNHDRYTISVDAREKIISIREQVIFLASFFDDFPDKASRRLEGKIRDVANEAEDIIEYFVWKRLSRWTVPFSRVDFEQQLQKVTEEIGLIAGELIEDRPSPAAIRSSSFASTYTNDMVIGLDEDLMAIKHQLCGGPSKLQVVPIVGMGGIGKTTLTRNAYDDPLIIERFDIRAWVTITQNYNAQEILSRLLDSMKLFDEQMLGQENDICEMAVEVHKILKSTRYLIVMDDIWSTEAWDDVQNILPDDNNGSRIILTTRLSSVATCANSSSLVHEMKFIDENQSWILLKQKVFTNDNIGKDCPPELEDIGKDIARSCGGLPLALVLVARILSSINKTQASWGEIARNVNSVVAGQLEEILSLSYTHLPHHLRPCFLFMGGFPEDYKIHVSKLVKIWVAEGILKHQDGYRSLEEDAEEYLEDLVKRRLVLVTSRKTNGKIKSCGLHDLVRDLCIRTAQEEKFLAHFPGSISNERRVSIAWSPQNNMSPQNFESLQNKFWGPTIRTVISFHVCLRTFSSLNILRSLRLLRVLDVVDGGDEILPSQVFELFHLRYLALDTFVKIPSAISNLENLQTLIIVPTTKFQAKFRSFLPIEIWRMPQLRHLVFSRLVELPDPADASTLLLENLQTFSLVSSNLVCSEKILKMIPNLKKLGIICKFKEFQPHISLTNLHQLEKLKVIMSRKTSWHLHNLALPRALKKLTLLGGTLPLKDMNIVGSLPYLKVLKLKDCDCHGGTWETVGEFPQLKCLIIERSNLQFWITESSHFPRLKYLKFRQCQHLNEIPEGIGEISMLEVIDVDDVNMSLVASAIRIQEDQLSYGNETLQIRVHHDKWAAEARAAWVWAEAEAEAVAPAVAEAAFRSWYTLLFQSFKKT